MFLTLIVVGWLSGRTGALSSMARYCADATISRFVGVSAMYCAPATHARIARKYLIKSALGATTSSALLAQRDTPRVTSAARGG